VYRASAPLRRRWLGRLLLASVSSLGLLNVLAYRHARAFTEFAPEGERTPPADRLSVAGKLRVLVEGPRVARPANHRNPPWPFETHRFPGSRGTTLEAWWVPLDGARTAAVLLHGHAGAKASLIGEARALRELGLATLLVDFHGSGGSSDSTTSIGWHEAGDVVAALQHARDLPGIDRVVLYGESMGAVAAIRAAGPLGARPDALILECPFDSLAGTVRHRFQAFGVPAFPAADLLLFWGGLQQGFDAFAFNPRDDAAQVTAPTLLLNGDRDPWVRVDEAQAIYRALPAQPRAIHLFRGLGHESLLRSREEWLGVVSAFLGRLPS
jgi:alpha-beta hydrolase superfamily lysophospholipase